MVTSLVAALYLHSCPSEEEAPEALESRDTLRLIHNVAQYAHSQAQGKVGSGFDVSSAIWGSQVYTRFSPECLSSLLESENVSAENRALTSTAADETTSSVRRSLHPTCSPASRPLRSSGYRKRPLPAAWPTSACHRVQPFSSPMSMLAQTRPAWLARSSNGGKVQEKRVSSLSFATHGITSRLNRGHRHRRRRAVEEYSASESAPGCCLHGTSASQRTRPRDVSVGHGEIVYASIICSGFFSALKWRNC